MTFIKRKDGRFARLADGEATPEGCEIIDEKAVEAAAILEARRKDAVTEWIFPAPTRSGHIEKSSLKKQHLKACRDSKVERFPLYTLRHTCLTRWARTMDPYTLAYLAGHSDFGTTKRYVHPQVETMRKAIEAAIPSSRPGRGTSNEGSIVRGNGWISIDV